MTITHIVRKEHVDNTLRDCIWKSRWVLVAGAFRLDEVATQQALSVLRLDMLLLVMATLGRYSLDHSNDAENWWDFHN